MKNLHEEITEVEIEKKLKNFLKSKGLTDKIKKEIESDVKSDKETEKMVVDITSNVLTQLFKALWVKRSFWQSQLKNKSA